MALKAHPDGHVFGDKRTTVEQSLRAWLRSVEPSVGPRTWIRYEELIRRHAVPYIGKVPLTWFGARHPDQLYGELVLAGLSPTTVVQLHRILHHAHGTRCAGTMSPQCHRAGHPTAQGPPRLRHLHP